jgi:hypothetical protein
MPQVVKAPPRPVPAYKKLMAFISRDATGFNFDLSSKRYHNRIQFQRPNSLGADTERQQLSQLNNSSFLNCSYQTHGYAF